MTTKSDAAQVADERQERYVDALQQEYAGYVGNPAKAERAKAVAAELRANGANPDEAPKGRRSAPAQTAAAIPEATPEAIPAPGLEDGAAATEEPPAPAKKTAAPKRGRGRLAE